jgi:hypothetical protein
VSAAIQQGDEQIWAKCRLSPLPDVQNRWIARS